MKFMEMADNKSKTTIHEILTQKYWSTEDEFKFLSSYQWTKMTQKIVPNSINSKEVIKNSGGTDNKILETIVTGDEIR